MAVGSRAFEFELRHVFLPPDHRAKAPCGIARRLVKHFPERIFAAIPRLLSRLCWFGTC